MELETKRKLPQNYPKRPEIYSPKSVPFEVVGLRQDDYEEDQIVEYEEVKDSNRRVLVSYELDTALVVVVQLIGNVVGMSAYVVLMIVKVFVQGFIVCLSRMGESLTSPGQSYNQMPDNPCRTKYKQEFHNCNNITINNY